MMMDMAMRSMAACTPHCHEVLELSAKLAENCADKCKKHTEETCKMCSTKCAEWATEARRAMKEVGNTP